MLVAISTATLFMIAAGLSTFAAWRLRGPARQLHVALTRTADGLSCRLSVSGDLRALTIDSITVDRRLVEHLGIEPPAGFAVAASKLRDRDAFKADLEDLLDGGPANIDAAHWERIAAEQYDDTVRSVRALNERFVNWTGRVAVTSDAPQALEMACSRPQQHTCTAGQILFGHRHRAGGMSVHGSSTVDFDPRESWIEVSCPIK